MAKKDAASKWLAEEIALAELLKKVPPLFTPEEQPTPPAPEELPTLLQLGDPWPASLGGDPWSAPLGSYGRDAAERPILDAFKAFGLDHRSLSDWRALVSHLARVLFPTPRPPGAPRKWTDERLCRLLAKVAAAKRKDPNAFDTVICKRLEKRDRSVSAVRLRRVLQDARNPTRNRLLVETALALVTPQKLLEAACAMTKDGSSTETAEKKLRSRVIWWAIENADKLWDH
jgi:hypothetical protein